MTCKSQTSMRKVLPLELLEERLQYRFKDKTLLQRALTHRSFSAAHNERLEFLGDSILNMIIAHALYIRHERYTEGILSRVRANLVCEKGLDKIAARIGVGDFIYLGGGEVKTGGAKRPSIIADACEAIFGAIFLDGGFDAVQKVILGLYEGALDSSEPEVEPTLAKDSKTQLQEYLQARHLPIPVYRVQRVTGPQHNQEFFITCTIASLNIVKEGTGGNRRKAEQNAALKVLEELHAKSAQEK